MNIGYLLDLLLQMAWEGWDLEYSIHFFLLLLRQFSMPGWPRIPNVAKSDPKLQSVRNAGMFHHT